MRFSLPVILSLYLSITLNSQSLIDFKCGVEDLNFDKKLNESIKLAGKNYNFKNARFISTEMYICRIGIEIDYNTYKLFNEDTLLIKFQVTNLIDKISKTFEKEINTRLVITKFNIWKDYETDPYKNLNSFFEGLSVLDKTWTNSQSRNLLVDKVIYLPTKLLTPIGGVANTPGKFSVSFFGKEETIAHELGHNFGSPHTQSCSWEGGMIDYCSEPENGDCYLGQPEQTRGTIMSYCNSKIFNFHPKSREVMYLNAVQNLEKIAKLESPPSFESAINSPYIYIKNNINAQNYTYQISSDLSFKNILVEKETADNVIYFSFKKNLNYYVRAKCKNVFGATNWSEILIVKFSENSIEIPNLLSPENNSENMAFEDINLEWESLKGVDSYEIQLIRNIGFLETKNIPIRADANSFIIKPNDSYANITKSDFEWKVRAISNGKTGQWSEVRQIKINEANVRFDFTINNYLTQNLNIFLEMRNQNISNKLRFVISEKNDFSELIYEKKIEPSKFSIYKTILFSGVLQGEKFYYYKLEELNDENIVIKSQGSDFFVPKKVENNSITHINSINSSLIGQEIENIKLKNEDIFGKDEIGFFKFNNKNNKSKNKEIIRYDLTNTNGLLTNEGNFLGFDSLGNMRVLYYKTNLFNTTNTIYTIEPDSIKLIKKQSFDSKFYIQRLDPIHLTFISEQNLYKVENDSVIILKKLPSNFKGGGLRYLVSNNYVWWIILNVSDSKYSLDAVRYDSSKNETNIYYNILSKEMPITSFKVDKIGNLYISTWEKLIKFDGLITRTYLFEGDLNYGAKISIDQFDNIYVTNPSATNFLKIEDNKLINSYKIPGVNEYEIDKYGKFIALKNGNDIFSFNPCNDIIKPHISYVKNNENFTLKAEGCTSVIWNWKNVFEKKVESLILNNSQLNTKFKSNTRVFARCYNNGCSGEEDSLNISVDNTFLINKILKKSICGGDSIILEPKIAGNIYGNEEYYIEFKNSEFLQRIIVSYKQDSISIPTKNIPVGTYWLKLWEKKSNLLSSDSLIVVIKSYPNTEIKSSEILDVLSGTTIIFTLKENSNYTYKWFKNDLEIAGENKNTLSANQEGKYYAIVNSLGCEQKTQIKNVKIILSDEQKIFEKMNFKILQNPNDGVVNFEYYSQDSKAVEIKIFEMNGKMIHEKSIEKMGHIRESISMENQPVGIYILGINKLKFFKNYKIFRN